MADVFLDGKVTLQRGDCLEVLPTLDENSIDSVVCDPPYHLTNNTGSRSPNPGQYTPIGKPKEPRGGFMGKQWDGGDIAFRPETWTEVYRVLKPGGHLLAFSGTRTYHRMACAIEDAGFEIRDQIGWCYGSGFPKSHDVSKGIDRMAGAEREVIGVKSYPREGTTPVTRKATTIYANGEPGENVGQNSNLVTAPATDQAIQWQGWGTALKPAWEPIVLARKPLSEKTIAANVLKWGTGAINVDGCRIAATDNKTFDRISDGRTDYRMGTTVGASIPTSLGRWPANLIHDGSEEVLAGFPETTSGTFNGRRNEPKTKGVYGKFDLQDECGHLGDSGSAARFFYTAKADADDRLGSKHPTVKPLDLIQHLIRLVTPKGGTVLDPFAGTGTTGESAWREGCRAVLIERETEYQEDIVRRMGLCLAGPDERRSACVKQESLTDLPMFAAL